MNNHEHTECEHEMAYCKVCKIPYCKKCGKEWQEKTYTSTTNPWVSGGLTLCGQTTVTGGGSPQDCGTTLTIHTHT